MSTDNQGNYTNKDLRFCDFEGQDLTGANFGFSNLQGAKFSRATLKNAIFYGADIRGCNFTDSSLEGASFECSQIGVSDEKLINLFFSSIGFSCFISFIVALSGSSLGVSFDDSDLSQKIGAFLISLIISILCLVIFTRNIIISFNNQELTSILFSSSMLFICLFVLLYCFKKIKQVLYKNSYTCFNNANLNNVCFARAVIKHADFQNANITNIDWTDAIINVPLDINAAN